MEVQFAWELSWSDDRHERHVHLAHKIKIAESHGLLDRDLQKRLKEIEGVDYAFDQGDYAIQLTFGKLYDPESKKEKVIEAIREWIQSRHHRGREKVVMVEVSTKGEEMQTTKHYDKVKQFMQNGGQETPDCVTIPDEKTRILRARLMLEEVLETIQDGLGLDVVVMGMDPDKVREEYGSFTLPHGIIQKGELIFRPARPVNLVEVADGCADTKVVTTGTLIAFGIPDDELQDIVDDSNLAKGNVKDEHGKIQKPPGWQPPDVKGFLERISPEAVGVIKPEDTIQIDDPKDDPIVKSVMAIKAEQRPDNFEQLSPEEQWEIDKGLGILDWDGK